MQHHPNVYEHRPLCALLPIIGSYVNSQLADNTGISPFLHDIRPSERKSVATRAFRFTWGTTRKLPLRSMAAAASYAAAGGVQ